MRLKDWLRSIGKQKPIPTCESCGDIADVRLADGSVWCFACHGTALRHGYDTDTGVQIGRR